MGRSRLATTLSERLGVALTASSWNTVRALLELAGAG
jgi:uncharacterized protein (DUF1697 family)